MKLIGRQIWWIVAVVGLALGIWLQAQTPAVTIQTVHFVDAEVPQGAYNGIGEQYSLANPPSPASSLMLFRNGILMKQPDDYSLSGGNTINWVGGSIVPNKGDVVQAFYRY